jgi:multiple antibiotic resistance protein
MQSLFSLISVLFLVLNVTGNIPLLESILRDLSPKEKRHILLREMGFALLIMLLFNFLDNLLFKFLNISPTTVKISSGIILFLSALPILLSSKEPSSEKKLEGVPYIFPIAIPLIVGPASLATIMLYSHLNDDPKMLLAILIAWFASLIVLLSGPKLLKIGGKQGIYALEKLFMMILVLIAIQRLLNGITSFIADL